MQMKLLEITNWNFDVIGQRFIRFSISEVTEKMGV
jgi:hypothetical protein